MDELASVTKAAQAAWETVGAHLRRQDLVPRLRERLEMVKGLALGGDLTDIVRWSGRSERTVRYWRGRFATGGVAALADAPRPGRPPTADAAYRAALDQAVATPPPRLGLPFDVWTSDRLAAYLAETTGKRLAPSWLRTLLGPRDYASGRPKHTLRHLQDAEAKAAGKEALAAVEKKGGRGSRAL